MGEADTIRIEVVYALPDHQALVSLQMPAGSTAGMAIAASGLPARFPELAGALPPLAVFGRPAVAATVLAEGDRVELLRPLMADPKERRRVRVQAVRRRRR